MKWYSSASSSATGGREVSLTKGEARAKALCELRIWAELLRASPRRSGGKPAVKLLKSWSSGPMSMPEEFGEAASWFKMTESTAWVPHAFWIVWAAKKRPFSVASGSKVPSCGEDESRDCPLTHLKRKMTPYTGLDCCISH